MSLYKNGDIDFSVYPDNIPNSGILFDDKSIENRGGHLGHAMVEYAPGKILGITSFIARKTVSVGMMGNTSH